RSHRPRPASRRRSPETLPREAAPRPIRAFLRRPGPAAPSCGPGSRQRSRADPRLEVDHVPHPLEVDQEAEFPLAAPEEIAVQDPDLEPAALGVVPESV